MSDSVPKENEDFSVDQNGKIVFTREYHLKRGYCCGSMCKNCPYGNSPDDRYKK